VVPQTKSCTCSLAGAGSENRNFDPARYRPPVTHRAAQLCKVAPEYFRKFYHMRRRAPLLAVSSAFSVRCAGAACWQTPTCTPFTQPRHGTGYSLNGISTPGLKTKPCIPTSKAGPAGIRPRPRFQSVDPLGYLGTLAVESGSCIRSVEHATRPRAAWLYSIGQHRPGRAA